MAVAGLYMDDQRVKPVGYVALGAGMVLGGLAVYLFLDGPSDSKASRITITPSRSEPMVGWSTKF